MSGIFMTLKSAFALTILWRNVWMTLGRQILAAGAQLLLVVLVARQLGPQGNGIYAMAILLPTLLANILNFGVGSATVFYLSRRDFSPSQVLSGNIWMAVLVSVTGCVLAAFSVRLWGGALFPGVASELLYLGIACFPIILFSAYLNAIFQALENFRAFNIGVLLPPYINLICVLVVIYILDMGVVGAMISYILGQISGLFFILFLLSKEIPSGRGNDRPRPALVEYGQKILSYGWKAHLANILAFVNYRADILLVNLFLTPAFTGIYVIAVQIAEKLWMFSQAACAVLLPRMSAMHDNPEGRLALANRGFVVVVAVTACVGMPLVAALYWLISPVFGEEYRGAWPALLCLLPGIIAGAGARVQSNCIAAAGKPDWNMYVALCVILVNLTGNVVLIPKLGIVGASMATSIAYVFNAAIKLWLIKKTLHVSES